MVKHIQEMGFDVFRMPIAGKDEDVSGELPDFTKFKGRDAIDLIARRKIEAS